MRFNLKFFIRILFVLLIGISIAFIGNFGLDLNDSEFRMLVAAVIMAFLLATGLSFDKKDD